MNESAKESFPHFKRFLSAYAPPGECDGLVVELRPLEMVEFGTKRSAFYGFFKLDQPDPARDPLRHTLKDLVEMPPGRQAEAVYVTLNPVKPDLFARSAGRIQAVRKKGSTSATDSDIVRRRFLLVDVDPVRPAGVSSTDAEKAEALKVLEAILEHLTGLGWPLPLVADSGNGFHLWYRIDLPADDGGLVRRVLQALGTKFDTAAATVDRSVFNPSRVAKVPGTWARKGDDIPERPHRMAKVLECPDRLAVVTREHLESVGTSETPPASPQTQSAPPVRTPAPRSGERPDNRVKRCRAYLEKVPDAVSGQHGHDRTFHAARVIWNDFAIDEADGWPILVDYNERLGEKWTEKELRHKWDDAVEKGPENRGSKLKEDRPGYQPPRRGTGGSPPVGVPAQSAAGNFERVEVKVGEDEYRVNAEAAVALSALGTVYARGQDLVQVIETVDAPDPCDGDAVYRRPVGSLYVHPLPPGGLRNKISEAVRFLKWVEPRKKGEEGSWEPTHVPPFAVTGVGGDPSQWWAMPALEAIVPHPVLAPNGVDLVADGYDRRLRAYVARGVSLSIPARPSREAARKAVALVTREVLHDFPFSTAAHRSGWLAALLTPLAWFMFDGPSPFVLIDANAAGAGKGLLANAAATILLGHEFATAAYTHDPVELEKVITTVVRGGDRFCLFDNLAGSVGNPTFDLALTSRRWRGRILGESRHYEGPMHTLFLGTGNNVELRGDTGRRTLHVRMDCPVENPEERTGWRHPDLIAHLRENRGVYLSAALTVLKAWALAGRPTAKLPDWGSFEGWSSVVRQALVWAGERDPAETRSNLRERSDRGRGAFAAMLAAIRRVDPKGEGITSADLVGRATAPAGLYGDGADKELAEAISAFCNGKLNSGSLGNKLRGKLNSISDGYFLDSVPARTGTAAWIARPISEFRVSHEVDERSQAESAGSAGSEGSCYPPRERTTFSPNKHDLVTDEQEDSLEHWRNGEQTLQTPQTLHTDSAADAGEEPF